MNAQNYHKASAEALGLHAIKYEGKVYANTSENEIKKIWQPDLDANQMLMVWDWLREQGYAIRADDSSIVSAKGDREKYWYVHIRKGLNIVAIGRDADILLATAEAFMSYYETIK